jgi:phosphopantothenoylcysteine decarboxylase / phosphopantothenate---cysteine ligase
VCGSISAYKTYDLARGLVKLGHSVRVVLSKGAQKFVQPEVFRYLGAEQVFLDEDDFTYPRLPGDAPVLHVDLAKWCERFIVAPMSANTLSDFAMARAQGLLSTVFLALPSDRPVMLFPAMNTQMLNHPFVQENINILERFERHPNCFIAPTESGLLACGDEGEGKLMDVERMLQLIHWHRRRKSDNSRKILITTGATIAPLDPVRYLTNPSSGLTGALLAAQFHKLGDEVVVIAGKEAAQNFSWLTLLRDVSVISVTTTQEMYDAVHEHLAWATHYYSPAAIADFSFAAKDSKIKKETLESGLEIIQSPDILQSVLQNRRADQKIIGFAAETQLDQKIINEKLQRKPVDVLVATQVNSGHGPESEQQGFAKESASYKIFVKNTLFHEGPMTKLQLVSTLAGELA